MQAGGSEVWMERNRGSERGWWWIDSPWSSAGCGSNEQTRGRCLGGCWLRFKQQGLAEL